MCWPAWLSHFLSFPFSFSPLSLRGRGATDNTRTTLISHSTVCQSTLTDARARTGGQQQQQGLNRGGGRLGNNRGKSKKNRSKQDSRANGGNGNHCDQVRDAWFVGPEGHPPGTDRIYNAARYPPNLRRPQGAEPAVHADDPRRRWYRCD